MVLAEWRVTEQALKWTIVVTFYNLLLYLLTIRLAIADMTVL
jgi:hypothetical protein